MNFSLWFESFWCQFEEYITEHQGIGPVFGAIIGAIISSIFSLIILLTAANRYSKRTKRIDSTFAFNSKYHDILSDRQKINETYRNKHNNELLEISHYWWLKYFDLMLFELHFFQYGYIMEERFAEWMDWRRVEHNAAVGEMNTGGKSYVQAWSDWRAMPAVQGSLLVEFLDEVHVAKDAKHVQRIVKCARGPWRWRVHRSCIVIGRKLQAIPQAIAVLW